MEFEEFVVEKTYLQNIFTLLGLRCSVVKIHCIKNNFKKKKSL